MKDKNKFGLIGTISYITLFCIFYLGITFDITFFFKNYSFSLFPLGFIKGLPYPFYLNALFYYGIGYLIGMIVEKVKK